MPRSASLEAVPVDEPLDVDLDELLEDEGPRARDAVSPTLATPPGLESLAADVEATVAEQQLPRTSAHVKEAVEDLGVDGDAVVSYAEPAIAPAPEPPHRPEPVSMRVPAIPDLDLHVAAALESVAQRIRAGELSLPPVAMHDDEASSIALALSALLASRR